ncbi:MAG: penicillin-binding transpeptidase domain-containing protein, partial [Alphaproteobacteria bacterium]|nr:penicillin-binding transpeptidase domain-containing protein [Alphaproteobacteria bacterium]
MTGRPTKRPVRPAAGQRAVPVPGKTMIRLEGTAARTMRLGHGRLLAVALMFGIGFCVLAGRLVELTVVRGGDGAVANLVPGTIAARPERADIVDRHGLLLATNLSTASLYADAREVLDANRAARRLAKVLPELSLAATAEKLRSDKAFVWLKRNLTPALQDRIHRLGIPGLYFREEQRRLYPHGALAAHVLGFTDVDGNGIAGVEKFFDEELLRRGHAGAPLQLSLDIRVQHALRDELGAAMAKFSAVGAAGLVMNANTGEVLGLASLPDFDPNHPGASPVTSRFNRTSLGVYELGSVFKVFTLAMALDSGTTNLSGSYDASKPIRVSRF